VPEEEVVAPNTQEAETDGQRIASPLAKKIASDKGIQLTQVKVQVKMDVSLRAMSKTLLQPQQSPAPAPVETAAKAPATPAPAAKVFVPAGEVLTEEIKNSQMRKIIASD
jgi:pyruvate dehydrogenase E2 component (dihydrolipoamide acetyltransferase)